MNYLKVIFRISPMEEWYRDLLIDSLAGTGFDSFIETSSGFEGYIPDNLYDRSAVNSIPLLSDNHFTVIFDEEKQENRNWNEEWEKNYFRPLLISEKCLIRAPFHTDFPEAEIEIIIEPNMAFGTGNHETTSLMIESILNLDLRGKTVLDMGCGTGILAILASKLGAKKVTAIDVSEWAYEGAVRNSLINRIENIKVLQGDASLLGSEIFDFIFANIQRNVILDDLEIYSKALISGGIILLSGFYARDLPAISRRAEETGLKFSKSIEKNGWVAAIYKKVE